MREEPAYKFQQEEFEVLTPWAEIDPPTKLQTLLSKMLETDHVKRISIKEVKKEFSKIAEGEFSFEHIEVLTAEEKLASF